ncbi:MAG: twin-arginine translocase subunit TatC [Candidatus Nanohaloarchaea archaeon]
MQGLDAHLIELKKRFRLVALFFLFSVGLSFYFSSNVLEWVQSDLGFSLHALTAYEVLYTQLLIAFLLGLLLSLPFIFYEALEFMRPGLKEEEYRALRNYLPFSVVLFLMGAAFSYNYIVKFSLGFLQSTTDASSVPAIWGLQNTVGFALRLSALTGIIFQLPIFSLILARAGLLNREMMVEYRPYFFIVILVVSAVATPPDVISQVLVTGPVLLLYQLSIFLVGRVE